MVSESEGMKDAQCKEARKRKREGERVKKRNQGALVNATDEKKGGHTRTNTDARRRGEETKTKTSK